jgi:AcrR family transcriptional regulator
VTDRPYHHGALEGALTDAAMEVVRTTGIADLSLRDLARAVGVSPSATYRHFPSREHLVAHVSQCCREEFARALLVARDAVPAKGGAKRVAVARFQAIGRAYIDFAVQHTNVFAAAFATCDVRLDREDDPSAWLVLNDSIDELVDSGEIPASRRKDAPIIAWAGVHGLSQILTASTWPTGIDAHQEIDAVIHGINRAIH